MKLLVHWPLLPWFVVGQSICGDFGKLTVTEADITCPKCKDYIKHVHRVSAADRRSYEGTEGQVVK